MYFLQEKGLSWFVAIQFIVQVLICVYHTDLQSVLQHTLSSKSFCMLRLKAAAKCSSISDYVCQQAFCIAQFQLKCSLKSAVRRIAL